MPIAETTALLMMGGLNAGNSILGSHQSAKNVKRTIRANREMAEYAYAKDREMWNLQNSYNAPAAQMERLKAAGLNPNLVYGNGTVANNSGPVPRYNAPTVDFQGIRPPDLSALPQTLGMYQDYRLREANIANVQAHTENIRAKTDSEGFRKLVLQFQGKTAEFDLKRREALAPYQQTITESAASASMYQTSRAVQELQNMRQDELLKRLEADTKAKGLSALDLEIERRKAENLFLHFRNQWREMGVTEGDNPVLRIITRFLMESGMYNDLLND